MGRCLEKWTAYGARNWEGRLAGGLLWRNRPPAQSGTTEELGNKKAWWSSIGKVNFPTSFLWVRLLWPNFGTAGSPEKSLEVTGIKTRGYRSWHFTTGPSPRPNLTWHKVDFLLLGLTFGAVDCCTSHLLPLGSLFPIVRCFCRNCGEASMEPVVDQVRQWWTWTEPLTRPELHHPN